MPERERHQMTGHVLGDVLLALLLFWPASILVVLVTFGLPLLAVPLWIGAIGYFVFRLSAGRRAPRARGWSDEVLGVPGRPPTFRWSLIVSLATWMAGIGLAGLLASEGFSAPSGFREELIDYTGQGGWRILVVLLAAGVVMPVLEELTFRGVIMKALLRRRSPAFAVLVSSLLFGAFHLPGGVGLLLISTFLGVACAAATWVARSTLAGIAIHVFWNSSMIFFSVYGLEAENGVPGAGPSAALLILGMGAGVLALRARPWPPGADAAFDPLAVT